MRLYRAGDKVVTVIVARLHTQRQWPAFGVCHRDQAFRHELLLKKRIVLSLIDKYGYRTICGGSLHQCTAIPGKLGTVIVAQISVEGFFTLGKYGINDGSKG